MRLARVNRNVAIQDVGGGNWIKETDWKSGMRMRSISKICVMELCGLDTSSIGQGQVAGTSKHGNET